MTTLVAETTGPFMPVALDGLVGVTPLAFPLYLSTGRGLPVLYRDERTSFTDVHLARLQMEGVTSIFIREQDRELYHRRVEGSLDRLLRNPNVPLEHRVSVLHGVAAGIAQDLLEGNLDRPGVLRAQKMLSATSALVLREKQAFAAVRSVLQASPDLVHHSMVVSFLCLGLMRQVVGGDQTLLQHAGLAGLLHDIGRVGREEEVEDGEHVRRGYETLVAALVPKPVCDAVLHHHERCDGSGYPLGVRSAGIPVLARVVGLVDTFVGIYTKRDARVGVFDALRILAEVYRGCFDEQFAVGLVQIFR